MAKKITPAEAAGALKTQKHKISREKAVKMAKKYQKFRKALIAAGQSGGPIPTDTPAMALSYSFDKKAVQALLKEPTAVGLRIYPGVNEAKDLTLVLVAFDANGNNIVSTPPVPVTAKSAAKAGVKANATDVPEDGILDEAQSNPPYPSPPTP